MVQDQLRLNILELASTNLKLSAVIKADLGRLGAQIVSGIGFLGSFFIHIFPPFKSDIPGNSGYGSFDKSPAFKFFFFHWNGKNCRQSFSHKL